MNDNPQISRLQRRIRSWLPAGAGLNVHQNSSIEALEADFNALENELQVLFPDKGTGGGVAEALREQAVLRTVLESMVEGLIVADMEGCFLIFNKAAKTLLGQGPVDSGPSGWSEEFGLFREDGETPYPSEALPLSRALQGESVDDETLVVRTPARPADCHISASARPLWDHSGQQVGGIVVFHDVTGFKQVEQELRRAREIAEANDRAKSEFLANMSHEIRTPLTAVLGFSDLLLDANLTESDRLNYVQSIRRNGEHLLALISDVLDLSKLNANKLQVEKLDCSLPSILHEIASIMQVRALDKKLLFSLSYATPIPTRIRSDPMRVRQVLFNLLSNAIKFTRQGQVQIVARCVDAGTETARVEIDVVDTGIGLSDKEIDELFQPFHQANPSTTREFGGTGLGLTICRSLAEVLGGEVLVRSKLGEGSTFTLVLPGAIDADAEMANEPCLMTNEPEHDKRGPTGTAMLHGRILLAEDGLDNQVLLSTILRKQGLEVDIAENGQVAVEQALQALQATAPFDLILMDMQMPKLDGYGATAKLRSKGYSGPIVALTAHAMTGERERCIAAGCDDYLTKPIARGELLGAIEAHLIRVRGGASVAAPAEIVSTEGAPTHNHAPIHSSYADDADMLDLVTGFVERLPAQIREIQAAAEKSEFDVLIRMVHQIKGSAGGYGFMPVSEAAAALEAVARETDDSGEISTAVTRFAALCARVRGDSPRRSNDE